MTVAMLLTLATIPAQADDGVIEINFPTYRVGTHVLAAPEKILIDSFNEYYAGQYKLVVEELPSDMSYIEKMTILAATGDLPDIIEGKGGIVSLAVKNGQAHELDELLANDPEYAAEVGQAAIDSQQINGKTYSIPDINQCFSYFYNKDMFAQAGIEPATTWDEWMDNCQKLKDTLSQAIRSIGDFDLILCGKQTTDGDTAQVGPAVAEYMGIPHAAWVSGLEPTGDGVDVEQQLRHVIETVHMPFPCLVTVEQELFMPRLPSLKRGKKVRNKPVHILTLDDFMDKNPEHYGLSGSPTQVERIFPPQNDMQRETWTGNGGGARLFAALVNWKYIQTGDAACRR